jgi:MFS superfamily sulfate permease-like transporter
MAASGALLGYALLGTSRSLVVSATTSASAVSAAPVGPLAGEDATQVLALSAALALVSAAVLAGAGLLRLGGLFDFISKPVMTGFLCAQESFAGTLQLPRRSCTGSVIGAPQAA